MQNEPRVTMAAPSSGFTNRVMARLEERERMQARRRAWIGAAVLVSAIAIGFAIVGIWLIGWISLIAQADAFGPILLACSEMFGDWQNLIEGIWVAILVVAGIVGEMPLVAFACAVLMMTVVWVQIVTGSFQRILTIRLGGIE